MHPLNLVEYQMFVWKPCAGDVGCEQAELNPALVGTDYAFTGSTVHDDGTVTRVGLNFIAYALIPGQVALVANADGTGLDGFRPSITSDDKCLLSGAHIWNQRVAIAVAPRHVLDRFGGLLTDAGSSAPPVLFEVPQSSLLPGVPMPYTIGESRWLWFWAPANHLTSVSTVDGSGFAKFALVNGVDTAFGDATSTGPLFLFSHNYLQDAGTEGLRIDYSDGVEAPKPYLVAPEGSHFGAPAYAHTHVAFMRGVNPNPMSLNLYESVELWASPYSADPGALKPELLGPLVFKSISGMVGGWSHIGLNDLIQPGDQQAVQIWNLETKTKQVHLIPEGQLGLPGYLGVTRSHFWTGTGIKGKGGSRQLLRYPVE